MMKFDHILLVLLTLFALIAPARADKAIVDDKVKIGVKASGNPKVLEFETGSGTANPKLKVVPGAGSIQFAGDGVNFLDIGSGSGAGSGFNVIAANPDFETGISTGWTHVGGTFAAVSSGSNLLFGKGSATFQASASGQYVESALYSVPVGLQGRSCMARLYYLGGDGNLKLQALDSSNSVLGERVLAVQSTVQPYATPFLCPTSGSIKLRIVSTGSSALVAMDRMHLGEQDLTPISQATKVGQVKYAAQTSCYWGNSTTSGLDKLLPTGACTTPPSSDGAVTGSTGYVGFTGSLPPGEYFWQASGYFAAETTSGAGTCTWGLVKADGSATLGSTGTANSSIAGGAYLGIPTLSGTFTISGGNYTGGAYLGAMLRSGADCRAYTDYDGITFNLYRYPTQQEIAYRAETINWLVDARQKIGSTCAFNAPGEFYCTDSPGGVQISAPDKATTGVYGQACMGTNPSVLGNYSCTGNSAVGITLNIPAPQTVEVCSAMVLYDSSNSANFVLQAQLVETGNSDSTIIQRGNSMLDLEANTGSANARTIPFRTCANFKFSQGQHTVKLWNNASSTAYPGLLADGTADDGTRNIQWTAKPITQQVPAPVIVGGANVFSAAPGGIKVVGATMASDGTLINQTEPWLVLSARPSTGDYRYNIAGAGFTTTPVCTCSIWGNGASDHCQILGSGTTSTQLEIVAEDTPSGNQVAISHNLICVGLK